jgi:hypothetical protein
MGSEALRLQAQAFSKARSRIDSVIRQSMHVSDDLMLSIVLLGLTASWYDLNDTGAQHLAGAQVLMAHWLGGIQFRPNYQESFILGCFIYWQTISAFVVGSPEETLLQQEFWEGVLVNFEINTMNSIPAEKEGAKTVPHPLSGFSARLYLLVGQVGSLCRTRLKSCVSPIETNEYITKSQVLEKKLWGLDLSARNVFIDLYDHQTSVEDIQKINEVYRCAGLLQLYHYFPELLRMPGCPFTTKADDDGTSLIGSLSSVSLESLAVLVLQILIEVPDISGTCSIQGIPLLIAASNLGLPDLSTYDASQSSELHQHVGVMNNHRKPQIKTMAQCRHFIRHRLSKIDVYVGLKPVQRVREIVDEIFRRKDKGEACDWLHVLQDHGWETLLG